MPANPDKQNKKKGGEKKKMLKEEMFPRIEIFKKVYQLFNQSKEGMTYWKNKEYDSFFELHEEILPMVEFGMAIIPELWRSTRVMFPAIRITIDGKKFLAFHHVFYLGKWKADEEFLVPDNGTFVPDGSWIKINREPWQCYLFTNLIHDIKEIQEKQ